MKEAFSNRHAGSLYISHHYSALILYHHQYHIIISIALVMIIIFIIIITIITPISIHNYSHYHYLAIPRVSCAVLPNEKKVWEERIQAVYQEQIVSPEEDETKM